MAKKRSAKKRAIKSSSRRKGKKVSYKLAGKKAPVPIMIISILMYVLAITTILIGIAMFIAGVVGAPALTSLDVNSVIGPIALSAILGSLIFGGLFLIALGAAGILIARGIWMGRNWSRVLTVVIMVITFISALFVFDAITMLITGIISGYLWFSKRAKHHFTK